MEILTGKSRGYLKFYTVRAVKKCMKSRILLFSRDEPEINRIARGLETAGFGVIIARGLSELHESFQRHRISAVIVSRSVLFSHRIHPVTHLKAARSPIGIISWRIEPDGTARIRVNGARSEALTRAVQVLDAALGAPANPNDLATLSAPAAPNDPAGIAAEPSPGYPDPDRAVPPCHKKLKRAIEAIAEAGLEGISTSALTARLWGAEDARRAGDVHSYVSKARKLLASSGTDRRIVRSGKRYRMTGTDR